MTKFYIIINIHFIHSSIDAMPMEESVVIIKSDEDDSYEDADANNDENHFGSHNTFKHDLTQGQINYDKERKLNFILKQAIKTNTSFQDYANESQNSPTSSSKSYRKIKDIKNATNYKKNKQNYGILNTHDESHQQLPHNHASIFGTGELIDSLNENAAPSSNGIVDSYQQQETLKKNLSDSFVKRRERKGSLPEINTSHINSFYNFSAESSKNINSCLSLDPNSHILPNTSSGYLTKNEYIANNTNSNNSRQGRNQYKNKRESNKHQRYSRKSAFVLEVLRPSMFRSKSLTDLNSSIVKFDNNNTSIAHANTTANNMINSSLLSSKHLNKSMNLSTTLNNSQSVSLLNINSSNLFKTSFSINEK